MSGSRRLSVPYLERAGYVTARLKPEGFAYFLSLVPLFNTSVDRLEQVPERLRQVFEFSAVAALGDAAIRGEAGEAPARAVIAALAEELQSAPRLLDKSRVPRRRRSREAEDGTERARAVPSDQNRADRRGRRTRARSARAGDGARRGSRFVVRHRADHRRARARPRIRPRSQISQSCPCSSTASTRLRKH